ncbi:hypothetical protein OIV83_000679 [Microbotryomycetes sp. JL201]|nr:hypothetical protein OIV83_000679 [Microbotryomycetes sp. JL201]
MTDQHVLSSDPWNTEPRPEHLVESFVSRQVYNRNHGAVLCLDPLTFRLTLRNELGDGSTQLAERQLSVNDVRANYAPASVTGVLVCAGNRRQTMQQDAAQRLERDVQGIKWDKGAVANLQWTGDNAKMTLTMEHQFPSQKQCLALFDPLGSACHGIDEFPSHVDRDESLPVLIAYDMNGQPLTREHGAPLRIYVPSVIGARSVKWVQRIILRNHESQCFYQQKDYKVLPEEATGETKDKFMQMTEPMLEYDMNAAICVPDDNQDIVVQAKTPVVHVAGYAYGSRGVGIRQVNVTAMLLPDLATPTTLIHDLAQKLPQTAWTRAQLQREDGRSSNEKTFSWTLWSTDVKFDVAEIKKEERVAIVAYAGMFQISSLPSHSP